MTIMCIRTFGTVVVFGGVALSTAGCAEIGTDRTLFVTSTNVGLNIETQPPVSEFGFARRELAISPTFEGGQTPPLLGSFGYDGNWSGGINVGVQNNFAGGDAAIILGTLLDSKAGFPSGLTWEQKTPLPQGATLCIQKPSKTTATNPTATNYHKLDLPGPGEVAPLIVGTNTSFGLTVGWSGLTAAMPDTLRFGYNRKEMALAPITATNMTAENGCKGVTPTPDAEFISVRLPPFLATLDGTAAAGPATQSGTRISQFFATGDSATRLALQPNVRIPFIKRSVPTVTCESKESDSAKAIEAWIATDPAKVKILSDWAKNNAQGVSGPLFLSCGEYEEGRRDFIKQNNI